MIPSTDTTSYDHFVSLAESLPLGILSADGEGGVRYVNEASRRIFNRSAEELAGRGWERAVHRDDRAEVKAVADRVLSLGLPQEVVFRVDTGLFPRWAHAKFVPLGDGPAKSGWIATVDDVTERQRSEARLAHQATHDALTGLPNRTLLEDRLRHACARLQRDTSAVSVLFVDLDGFKEINDSLGHRAGDDVLVEVARRLASVVREVDTVARLGGDEFVIVCESLAATEVESLVSRIGRVLREPMKIAGGELVADASVGIATATAHGIEAHELLALADQQMYRHKRRR